jgi:CRP-like cAMP-binding protein
MPATVIFEPGQPITHVYFPVTGIVSLIVVSGDGSGVEVATVGNEGVVGLGGLLANDVSFTRQVVELAGDGVRIARDAFLTAVNQSQHLRWRLATHADAFAAQLMQSAACNARHDVEQRLARWLLTVTDRSGRSSLPITQNALAHILGVQRPTVTLTARMMQIANVIAYRRGTITVIDRSRLLSIACECYRIVNSAYDQAFQAGDYA